jgi:hypothetical protein
MSGAVNEAKGEAAAAAAPEAEEQPGAQIESQGDRFETQLEYDPKGRLPLPVALVWVCAIVGLGAYAVTLYFPDLALWGKP